MENIGFDAPKAIIEIDLPGSCTECRFLYTGYDKSGHNGFHCSAMAETDKKRKYRSFSTGFKYGNSRAPFCPLKIVE